MTPVDAVKRERNLRGWSAREAADHGGISNTTWGKYEKTGILTDAMQQAIMRAFDWEPTWAETQTKVAATSPDPDVLAKLSEVEQILRALTASVTDGVGVLRELSDRVGALERRRLTESPIEDLPTGS